MTDNHFSALSDPLHRDLFEFLIHSVSGGLVCGYIGEGFPFYFISDPLLHLLGFENSEEYCSFIDGEADQRHPPG